MAAEPRKKRNLFASARARIAGAAASLALIGFAVAIVAGRGRGVTGIPETHRERGSPLVPSVSSLRPAAPAPTGLPELLALPAEQLGDVDIARMNLLCASGLPGSEEMQQGFILAQIDRWTMLVATETARHAYRASDPKYASHYKHSYAYLCAEMMLQTLQQDCGVRYNVDRVRDPDFSDSRDQFLHGIVGRSAAEIRGGTCVSMPVLYAAVGRRLGYPIKLVQGSGHLFCRWDDADGAWARANGLPRGERFNIEGTDGFSAYPDEFYTQFPRPIDPAAVERGELLKSLTPAEELSVFLAARGHCLYDNRRFDEAIGAYEAAARLMPQASAWPWFAARTRDTVAMTEGHRMDRLMRAQARRSAAGLPVVEHPADRMRREGR